MRKPSEILAKIRVIGSYIRLEQKLLGQISAVYQRHRDRERLSERIAGQLRSLPFIGPAMGFPKNAREWLEDVPIVGPLVFRPCFWLYGIIARPAAILIGGIGAPLAAAGAVSAILHNSPDMASQPLGDYLRERGIHASLVEGISHKKVRVYRDGVVTPAFHAAAQQTALHYAELGKRTGLVKKTILGAVQYPFNLAAMLRAVLDAENAFTIPALGEDDDCYVRTVGENADSLSLLSSLSGLPERFLALDRGQLESWLPLIVLGHEAKHCDNGKRTLAISEELNDLEALLEETRAVGAEHGEAPEDSEFYKTAATQVARKDRELQRTRLEGEIGSDVYVVAALDREFPGSDVATIIKHARAVRPFVGSMSGGLEHATATGLDSYIRRLEADRPLAVWDAIEMARFLIGFGKFLNADEASEAGFNETLTNYHVTRDIVVPYLERNRDNYLPREQEHVRYALVLEQVRMFVEGMEYLIKPEIIGRSTLKVNMQIPDMPARQLSAPVPGMAW